MSSLIPGPPKAEWAPGMRQHVHLLVLVNAYYYDKLYFYPSLAPRPSHTHALEQATFTLAFYSRLKLLQNPGSNLSSWWFSTGSATSLDSVWRLSLLATAFPVELKNDENSNSSLAPTGLVSQNHFCGNESGFRDYSNPSICYLTGLVRVTCYQ